MGSVFRNELPSPSRSRFAGEPQRVGAVGSSVLLAWVLSAVACGSPPPELPAPALALAGSLQPGEHAVGFRKERLELSDAASGTPSALDLYLWYPGGPSAGDGAGEPLVLADYYRVQEEVEPGPAALRDWLLEDMTSPPGVETADLDALLAAPMWARPGVEAAPGSHPLVLWSYRDSVPTMQAMLNEFLASHGYVVAFAWPIDRPPPLPWQGESTADGRRRALETQIDLLEATLDGLLPHSWVDGGRVAVTAWSYGGESAAGLQRRRAEVRLALGVDATLVSGWIFGSAEELAAVDRAKLSATYALLRNGRPRIDGEGSPEPPLLAEVPAGSWYLRFAELSHGNFNFPGGMIPGVLDLPEVSGWAVGGETARLGYELICRHALGLLDLHLRGRQTDPASWSPGAPPGFVEVVRHPPQG